MNLPIRTVEQTLTAEQKRFLSAHRIPIERVFDAQGRSASDYKRLMKTRGYLVACNVTPCQKARHTLRTRYGHCVQCDTKHIAFINRHSEQGYVYLAASMNCTLVKIGASIDPLRRIVHLNGYVYGGASDWKVIATFPSDSYARHEHAAQALLEEFRTTGHYFDRGGTIECSELYNCDVEVARRAIEFVIGRLKTVRNNHGKQLPSRHR